MTTFATPYNDFVAQTAITSAQVDANFAAIATFFNTTGVNVYQALTITPPALGPSSIAQYRDLAQQTCLRTAIGVTTQFISPQGVLATVITSAAASAGILYIDKADYTLTGKTDYMRLVAWSQTETAPTSSTLTVALYPIASTAAGVPTLGTVVAGSSMTSGAITAANTRTLQTGADFASPTAGYYAVVFAHSVNPGQTLTYGWKLQARVQ